MYDSESTFPTLTLYLFPFKKLYLTQKIRIANFIFHSYNLSRFIIYNSFFLFEYSPLSDSKYTWIKYYLLFDIKNFVLQSVRKCWLNYTPVYTLSVCYVIAKINEQNNAILWDEREGRLKWQNVKRSVWRSKLEITKKIKHLD